MQWTSSKIICAEVRSGEDGSRGRVTEAIDERDLLEKVAEKEHLDQQNKHRERKKGRHYMANVVCPFDIGLTSCQKQNTETLWHSDEYLCLEKVFVTEISCKDTDHFAAAPVLFREASFDFCTHLVYQGLGWGNIHNDVCVVDTQTLFHSII